jgi:predicted anti-sigma-YlaC factor YlaD
MARGRMETCNREREWISRALDGELSEFEQVVVAAHLERCAECRAFAADVRACTTLLRSAPAEPLETGIWLGDPRRSARAARLRLRVAPAASAAAALAAAFLGVTFVPEGSRVAVDDEAAFVAAPLLDPAQTNELVLEVRRQRLAEGTQAVLPKVPGGIGAVKPPLPASPS